MKAGLIEIIRYTNANGMANAMILTPDAMEFLTGYNEKDVALVTNKQHLTMLCPPEDWSTAQDGGFISLRRKFVAPLLDIRRMRAEHRLGIREYFTAENVPQVFRVANYLQSIPYEVHMPTVQAIEKVWAAGGGAMGVPLKNGPRKPECPMPEDWKPREAPEEEVLTFTQWKRDMVLYYMNHREWKGKVRELSSFVHAVELHDGPMWFPIQIDRRCRWYYRGSPNPQGSDLSKAVLRFTDKKPLGADGVFWLKVHIANSLGFDKERFTVRARFTEDRWDALCASLDDPEANPDVWGTDAPWVAFSAAWELREAMRTGHPESYPSGLIVHMDATCSGLQHFSAMLRDPIGGRYVNLVDELQCGPKQDIYARVGQNTMAAIKLDAENSDNPEIQHIAKWWLDVGISRTMAKKPVMTYVYGATLRGTARYIEEVIAQDMPHVVYPDPNRSFMYCSYCARKIFEGIEATVPAAASAMRWLKSIARQMSNKPLKWKTATGFQVIHDYPQYNLKRVTLHSCGVNMVTVKEIQKGTNSVHMQNAIAPNLVHAQDAAHMTMVADYMREAGMKLSGVHDSFGTHACDVRGMHKIIREQFVKLYESKNTLAEFLWDVGGVGEVPSRGTLDIRGILDSEFAFS
jgi:DNA-directed RNA polymerase